jgi:carboxypeptidase C (cathepsin A)
MPISWKDNKEGSLFFWLAKNRKTVAPENEKLIVWLNGGPGCSSMIGMMHEHGPFTIHANIDPTGNTGAGQGPKAPKYRLQRNDYSWNAVANVLYVEQPIRTGFSLAAEGARPIVGEKQVAADFRNFLLSFMQVFTQFKGKHAPRAGYLCL